jgi:ABC-2 type transport system ATP-binding protein
LGYTKLKAFYDSMGILEVKNLTKKFGDFTAVDNISFSLKEGEILGLLGPNGAGKTTTLQLLLGLTSKTGGEIKYFGKNLETHRSEILEQVNFSSAYTRLPKLLTVRENMTFISYLYNIRNRAERMKKIAEIFNLNEIWDKETHKLSAGQTTRLNIAKSLINFPKVLMMDEPTASLDPEVAGYIREFLENERKEFQVSIIITSHNMAEVEELCDRVVFINHGQVIADDSPANLAKTIETSHVRLLIRESDMNRFIEYGKNINFEIAKPYVLITTKEKEIPNLLRELVDQKINYDEISIERPTLEDYFLEKARSSK